MITGRLVGGLGNQLWIINSVIGLALKNKAKFAFDFEKCYTPLQGYKSTRYADNIFKNLPQTSHEFEFAYTEPRFEYDELPFVDDCSYGTYLQSYKYFYDFLSEIKPLFEIATPKFDYDVTGVHVRRGDYKNNPDIHPVCPLDYYLSSMDKVGGRFVICSDDIPWCKENFKSSNVFFSPYYNEVDDFCYLVNCNNIIGSNSSFSVWAALLNDNMFGQKIFPSWKNWFGSKGPSAVDMLPPEFEQRNY